LITGILNSEKIIPKLNSQIYLF